MISHLNTDSRPRWLAPQLYLFESHYVELDNCEIYYVDEGHGSTLLFVHSDAQWSFTYRHLIRGHFSQEDAPDQIVDAINRWSVLGPREKVS